MSRFVVVTDLDVRGSGYARIVRGLFPGVARLGHDIVVLGLSYDGREHDLPLSIVPADFKTGRYQMEEIVRGWEPDYFVVALDLTYGADLANQFAKRTKYVGIFPIESDPLLVPSEWHSAIQQMHRAFVISTFGQDCCAEAGVDTVYLPVPIDRTLFRRYTPEEKAAAKRKMCMDGAFIVLTVMDNQERKNWPAAVEAFARFNDAHPEANAYHVIVTKRRPNELGWRIPQLLARFGTQHRTLLQEADLTHNGQALPDAALAEMFGAADVYLHTSQAEGLGLTVLEAMSAGVPVVGTDCTSIAYHMRDGRGLPIDVAYKHIGSFMNGWRYFADPASGAGQLARLYEDPCLRQEIADRADRYVATMTEERAVDTFMAGLTAAPIATTAGQSTDCAPCGTTA